MEKKNNKKFTSWGVSFTSLALVAGMMSYMGITNKNTANKTNTVAQAQASTQSVNNQSSSISYELPSQTSNNATKQSTSQSSSADQTVSGHHGNFDTTTGGS